MKRITPKMMEEAIRVPVQTIRVGLQAGAFDWGTCYKPQGKNFVYVIYPDKVAPLIPERYRKAWGLA